MTTTDPKFIPGLIVIASICMIILFAVLHSAISKYRSAEAKNSRKYKAWKNKGLFRSNE